MTIFLDVNKRIDESMNSTLVSKRILFVSADPSDMSRLRLADEKRKITLELRLAGYDKVPMEEIGAAQTSDIQRALLDFSPQIVHFSGHGTGSSGLVFQDVIGRGQLVNGRALANLFGVFSNEGLECVVLNACYSSVQAELIAERINFVVGMSEEIGDRAAIAFSVGFYQAIGAGRSVELAYDLGCVAIQVEGFPEHLTPVLYKKGELVREYPKPAIKDEPLPICPRGLEHATPQMIKNCELSYPSEEIRLIEWNLADNGKDITALFRERRRGWYFQITFLEKSKQVSYRPSPFFLPLLQQDELAWNYLTKSALPEDWYALDEIIRLGLEFPGSKVLLVNQFTIGEPVWENAMEQFGFYVPDDYLLPAFLFLNQPKALALLSFFKHPDGFGKESSVSDDEECHVFNSLLEAQKSLKEKLQDRY